MLPEFDDVPEPVQPPEPTIRRDDLTSDELRLIQALREDRLPGWIKRKFERWCEEQGIEPDKKD